MGKHLSAHLLSKICQCAFPKGASCNGGMLQYPLFGWREKVNTGSQYSLDGIWNAERKHVGVRTGRVLVGKLPGISLTHQNLQVNEHSHDFLNEKRIPLSFRQDAVSQHRRQVIRREQRINEFVTLLCRERLQGKGCKVALAPAPARAFLQ